jgi:hypothetical protein
LPVVAELIQPFECLRIERVNTLAELGGLTISVTGPVQQLGDPD